VLINPIVGDCAKALVTKGNEEPPKQFYVLLLDRLHDLEYMHWSTALASW